MATEYVGPTHATRQAAESRLAMALDWQDITHENRPRIVAIRKPGQRPRYAIEITKT